MNAYRQQQLRAAALIEQGATAEQIALVYGWIPKPFHDPPTESGTIRNDPEQKDLAYQIGKAIARIIRRLLK